MAGREFETGELGMNRARDFGNAQHDMRFRTRVATLYCLGEPNLGVRVRSLHVRKFLRDGTWRSVADIGCAIAGSIGWAGGLATTPFLLARFHPHASVVGVDIDMNVVRRSESLAQRNRLSNLHFVRWDLHDVSPLEKRDVVILADIVANRPGDEILLRGACQLVKRGGRLIIHTASKHRPSGRIPSADAADILGVGYAEEEISQFLHKLGAEVVSIRRTFGSWGRIGSSLQRTLVARSRAIAILLFPFCLALSLPDLILRNSDGHGLLVVAGIGTK